MQILVSIKSFNFHCGINGSWIKGSDARVGLIGSHRKNALNLIKSSFLLPYILEKYLLLSCDVH